ncbi:hypothetical protein MPSEU_000449600 [Mayamaea pseudoterrestris]|nr:hypothetical protein MPSEU_000449600 [Mayamaea pseudoterrestris]
MAVDETAHGANDYEMIIGRDLLRALGIDILWSTGQLRWDNITIPMKRALDKHLPDDKDAQTEQAFFVDETMAQAHEGEVLMEATERASRILDAKYEKADINQTVDSMNHLTTAQKTQLKSLLFKFEHLFDGTLGSWDTTPVDFELKEGAQPYHARPYNIPQVHEATLRKEVARLCDLGVLRRSGGSEWAAPTFIIPKKNGTVRFISDFRRLNNLVKRKPFPIPHIQDTLLKLGGFTYATSLDLNMGYYTIRLSPAASQLCTIVLPWGKYEYCRLPMGVAGSPDIFQEKMSILMEGLDFVRTYLDDLLTITKDSFEDHLSKVEQVLERLSKAGLRVNIAKSSFATQELEYLGYWLTPTGIRPLPNKVEAILRIKRPQNVSQLRSFLGLINYYRDMWKRRSHILAPLTALTKLDPKQAFPWGEKEQHAFEQAKKSIAADVMLAFPDFTQPFDIHTDASDYQLGAVISQNGVPIAFYSRKLTKTQQRYTVGEREMLSIVETLKEYRNILLGHELRVYTDHKNNVDPKTKHASNRVQRWRWLIEEYGPIFYYLKGEDNPAADALSRLDFDEQSEPINPSDLPQHEELCLMATKLAEMDGDFSLQSAGFDEELRFTAEQSETVAATATRPEAPGSTELYPLKTAVIAQHQENDNQLQAVLNRSTEFTKQVVEGKELILYRGKIYIPQPLREPIIQWYHDNLCHPGSKRTEKTIRQRLVWPTIAKDVDEFVKKCHTCQVYKKPRPKYGKLPLKDNVEVHPWHTVCVDLIGPYTITGKDGVTRSLNAMTMADPSTGWFEVMEVKDKTADHIAQTFDRCWLCRYPRPVECIFDNGNEFLGRGFQEMLESFGIEPTPTTVKNPQANFVERVHQTLGNMLRTCELEEYEFPEDDPWTDLLCKCAWAIRSTIHLVLDASPGQLVFGRDMLFDLSFQVDWTAVRKRRLDAAVANNARENSKRIRHDYKVGDKVLLETGGILRKLHAPRKGPYTIQTLYTNGIAKISKGVVSQKATFRRLTPYND